MKVPRFLSTHSKVTQVPLNKASSALVLIWLLCGAQFGSASAYELRLTPSNVFSTWTNVNACLTTYAGARGFDVSVQRQLTSMTPAKFTDKRPSDVLEQVKLFRAGIETLRGDVRLLNLDQIPTQYDEVTPAIVYINSGLLNDALVELLIDETGPEVPVSQYYQRHDFTEKTPSDVFGLVDLANRRLELMLTVSTQS
jgi:hypothetical protein